MNAFTMTHTHTGQAAVTAPGIFTITAAILLQTLKHTRFVWLNSSRLSAGSGFGDCGPQAGPFLSVFAHFIVIEPAVKNRKIKFFLKK